jgi:hypothetical protein
VRKNFFPEGNAVVSNRFSNKSYTELKRFKNGIYQFLMVRIMKTLQWPIQKISKIVHRISIEKFFQSGSSN